MNSYSLSVCGSFFFLRVISNSHVNLCDWNESQVYGDIIGTQFHVINGTKLLSECHYDQRYMWLFLWRIFSHFTSKFPCRADMLVVQSLAAKIIDRTQCHNSLMHIKMPSSSGLFTDSITASVIFYVCFSHRLFFSCTFYLSCEVSIECSSVIAEMKRKKISIFTFPSTWAMFCGFFRLFFLSIFQIINFLSICYLLILAFFWSSQSGFMCLVSLCSKEQKKISVLVIYFGCYCYYCCSWSN